jgi:hypothetical protein
MTTEANFPLQQLCLKPSLYGRFSLDHLWPLLGDHQGKYQGRRWQESLEVARYECGMQLRKGASPPKLFIG